jgi:hypothetical protein
MQSREYRDLTDSVAIRDLVPVRPREPFPRHAGDTRTQAGVWSTLVVMSL